MAAYKDGKTGTWRVVYRYKDGYRGDEHADKNKREYP